MKLAGRVAFITGGGGGIGGGIAQAFAEKGMKLVLADIDLGHAQEQARQFGDDAIALQLDVTSLSSWAAARAAARKRFGSIDVLCNNAGSHVRARPAQEAPRAHRQYVVRERFDRVRHVRCLFGKQICRDGHVGSAAR